MTQRISDPDAQAAAAAAARARAAEAARRRAEEAATAAAARRAAQSSTRATLRRDELSTGQGRSLRVRSLRSEQALDRPRPSAPGAAPLPSPSAPQVLSSPAARAAMLQRFASPDAIDRARPPPTAADRQVEEARVAVEQAYASGGASAAAAELRERTTDVDAAVAANIVRACAPTVDRITQDLGNTSNDADGDQFDPSDSGRTFDTTVADLATAVHNANDPALTDQLASKIQAQISAHGVGRFDEALGNAVITNGSELAIATAAKVAEAGDRDTSDDILQNVNESVQFMTFVGDGVADSVNDSNGELGELVGQWGQLMTPEELRSAVDAFKETRPEFAQLEALSPAAIDALNALSTLPPSLQASDYADDFEDRTHELGELVAKMPPTTAGSRELQRLSEASAEGQPTLFDDVSELGVEIGKAHELTDALVGGAVNASVGAMTEALAHEPPDMLAFNRAKAGLEANAQRLGVDPAVLARADAALSDIQTATTPAERDAALARLNDIEGLDAASPVGRAMRFAGVGLSLVGAAGSLQGAFDDPSFESIVGAANGVAGLGVESLELWNGFSQLSFVEGAGFEAAGQLIGGVGVALSAVDAIQALDEGDYAEAGLYAAQAIGGAVALLGATGIGAVIGIAAFVGLQQLERVRYSNRHENESTEAFLRGGGVSNPDVTYHLRDADDGGRSVGPTLVALANHLGIPPTEMLDWVQGLSGDEVIEFVHAMHGVDPNDDGVYPETASNDAQVAGAPGTPGPLGTMYVDTSPHSLDGLVEWLRREGYDAPGI